MIVKKTALIAALLGLNPLPNMKSIRIHIQKASTISIISSRINLFSIILFNHLM